jgi:hypothetical protein
VLLFGDNPTEKSHLQVKRLQNLLPLLKMTSTIDGSSISVLIYNAAYAEEVYNDFDVFYFYLKELLDVVDEMEKLLHTLKLLRT